MRLQLRIPRAIAAIAATLMLTTISTAEATATFGRTTVGTTPSGGLRPDYKRGSQFTLNGPGVLKQLCAYLDGNGVGTGTATTQYFRLALYRGETGWPSEKMSESVADGAITAGTAAGWVCQDTKPVWLDSDEYFLVIHSGGAASSGAPGGSNIIRYFYDGVGNFIGNSDVFSDGASSQFGGQSSGDGTISAYGVIAGPGEMWAAGKTTVGATPSGALRINFKRGSSFTITQPVRVQAVSAYLDGLGGPTSGSQDVGLVLYKDTNGAPSELIGSYGTLTIPAGMQPRWITAEGYGLPELQPGKYWIMIHTSGPTAIARYYFDGTQNWYGNADTFSDGPANPFGAGQAGDGTMSAFISYSPGPFVTQTFGRTTIATSPTPALQANYFQGGLFSAPGEKKTLSAVYAYLDGLGGGTGSQKMKFMVTDAGGGMIEVSDEVTIPAGMPPQWVRFGLGPTRLTQDGYRLFLYVGQDTGVARQYADGPANTVRFLSNYPHVPTLDDGPNDWTPGPFTPSTYAEVRVPATP